jgi:replication initiation and membrane attachment protein
MKYLATRDFITIRRHSLISEIDKRLLAELYQPMIGHRGLALFLTLDAFHDIYSDGQPVAVSTILGHTQMSISDLSIAKANLEALGILKTSVFNHKDYDEYALDMFAPKTPEQFFDDVLLRGLLEQYVGEAIVQKLRLKYRRPDDLNDWIDQTASFGEVFHPDFSNPLYNLTKGEPLLGHRHHDPMTQFDRRAFLDEILKKSNLKPSSFTDKTLDEISRLANLYAVDELAMAELALASLSSKKGVLIDFPKLRDLAAIETRFAFAKTRKKSMSNVTSASSKAKKIELMQQTDPKTYFRYRNLNNAPAPSDMKLIDDIEVRFSLPYPVINALIDYVLETADLKFPRPLVEKIAASLARSQVTSAIDAMEYLLKTNRRKKKAPIKEEQTPTEEKGDAEDIDIDALLADYESQKAGSK